MITHDATTNQASNTGVSSLTFSHTVGGGADLLLVGLMTMDLSDHTISSVTYNSVGMTQKGFVVANGSVYFVGAGVFSLNSPAAGANDVVITTSEAMQYGIGGSANSYTYSGGTVSAGVTNKDDNLNTATRPTVSGIGSGAGELSFGAAGDLGPIGGSTWTPDSGETERADLNVNDGRLLVSEKFAEDELGWTRDSSPNYSPWAFVAVKITEPGGGGRVTKNTRSGPLGVEIGMGWRMPL